MLCRFFVTTVVLNRPTYFFLSYFFFYLRTICSVIKLPSPCLLCCQNMLTESSNINEQHVYMITLQSSLALSQTIAI